MTPLARSPGLAAAAALVLAACTTAPVTGRRELNLVSDGAMNQLGTDTYKQQLAQAKPDANPEHKAMVDRVAKRIVDAAEKDFHPGYQWTVSALDDPKMVNAWCLPGGKIAVYSGIFPLTQDDNGLAVVLAHEVSHALAHHGAERMSRSMVMQLGEAGLLAAVNAGKPELVKTTGALLGLGAQLGAELPFSREQESEADHIGLVLMAKAGYDPARAVDFWQRMEAYSKGKEPPAFLSDHPSSSDRIASIQRELPEARAAFVAHP
ncbi:MAG: M48 family metallopeptidase [Myxococcales bacterium]